MDPFTDRCREQSLALAIHVTIIYATVLFPFIPMSGLFSNDSDAFYDLSYDLRDVRDWKIATIREIEHLSDLTALAVEPTNGLIAIGTCLESCSSRVMGFHCVYARHKRREGPSIWLSGDRPYPQPATVNTGKVPPVRRTSVQACMCWYALDLS